MASESAVADFVASASDEAWARASRIARELDRVLDDEKSRHGAIARAAAELRLTQRQIYNLLKRYRVERRVSSLLPRRPARRKARLDARIEEIIETVLREQWLTKEEAPLVPVVDEIRARCEENGLKPPAYVSVQRRIAALFTPQEIALRRGCDEGRVRRLKPRPGYISAKHALEVCQIDHTPGDIQVAEIIDGDGVFIGRPYLTLATDVATRAITGFCLTLEKPSRMSVALCLAQAICPKKPWLKKHDIAHPWPMQGRPRLIVVDGGAEFWSGAFVQGCRDFGMAIRRRNKGTVHQGGVVERLLGKLNGVLGTLPGRTGRSIADRGGYASKKNARLTFKALERCVTLAIIDHNRSQNSKTLTIPNDAWRTRQDDKTRPEDNPTDVLLNFMPSKTRTISPQGISLFAIDYYDSWLGPLVARRDQLEKLDVSYDPRDMSHVYIRDPDGAGWRTVGRRDGSTASITLWEHLADRRRRRAASAPGPVEKVKLRREIAATAANAKPPKQRLRDAARAQEAAVARKPHDDLQTPAPEPPAPRPDRQKRAFTVEEW